MGFKQNFNYCMKQWGYSAYEFAKIIGASNQGVLNWQTGATDPYPKTKKKIASHFGITVEALLGDALPTLPEKGAEKAPGQEAEGYTEQQKDAIKFVLSLTSEQLKQFINGGRAMYGENKDD